MYTKPTAIKITDLYNKSYGEWRKVFTNAACCGSPYGEVLNEQGEKVVALDQE